MIKHTKSIFGINGFYTDESQHLIYYIQHQTGGLTIFCLDVSRFEVTSWQIFIVLPENTFFSSWYVSHGYIFLNFSGSLHIYRVSDASLHAIHKGAYHCCDAESFIMEVADGSTFNLVKRSLEHDEILWTIPDFPNAFVKCAGKYLVASLKEDRPHRLIGYSSVTGEKLWTVDVSNYGTARINPFLPEEPCSICGEVLTHQDLAAVPLSVGKLLVLELLSGRQHALIPDFGTNVFLTNDGQVYEMTKNRYGFVDLQEGKYTPVREDWGIIDKEIFAGGFLTRFSLSVNHVYGCTNNGLLFMLRRDSGGILEKQRLPLPTDGFVPTINFSHIIGERLIVLDNEGGIHLYNVSSQ
jgi:hypothetical protein